LRAGDWMFCTSIITLYLGLQSISSYGLVGIAITRYISIREPLLFHARVTHCRALAAAIALWIILLVTSAVLYFRLTPDGKLRIAVEVLLHLGLLLAKISVMVAVKQALQHQRF